MRVEAGVCWALVPARGGSKSIALKNLVEFAGRPLLDYGVRAAQAARRIGHIACSTDSDAIAARCADLAIAVLARPPALAGDASPVMDVVRAVIEGWAGEHGAAPEMVALIQPTSPLIAPDEIDRTVAALADDPAAGSAQTVIACPHNHHAFNQRVIADGRVDFRFPDERARAYNKQSKPMHYLFGNLVVFRAVAALDQNAVFARPSLPVEIPFAHGFDLDGPDDIAQGEWLIESGRADLSWLES